MAISGPTATSGATVLPGLMATSGRTAPSGPMLSWRLTAGCRRSDGCGPNEEVRRQPVLQGYFARKTVMLGVRWPLFNGIGCLSTYSKARLPSLNWRAFEETSHDDASSNTITPHTQPDRLSPALREHRIVGRAIDCGTDRETARFDPRIASRKWTSDLQTPDGEGNQDAVNVIVQAQDEMDAVDALISELGGQRYHGATDHQRPGGRAAGAGAGRPCCGPWGRAALISLDAGVASASSDAQTF